MLTVQRKFGRSLWTVAGKVVRVRRSPIGATGPLTDNELREVQALAATLYPPEDEKEAEVLGQVSRDWARRRTEEDGPDAVGEPLDVAAFERLVADAKAAAADARLGDANHLLATAQRRVTKALTVLLEGQTLVYDKDFETPREEYEYETARHKSYAELIPRAVEQRQPSTRAVELIDQFVGVSESMKSEAVDQASGGHYQDAIHTLQQATAQLQRALWVAGVRWARWSN